MQQEMTNKEYVGSTDISGEIQLDLLIKEGLEKNTNVLEIGCGVLHLGIPLIKYLNLDKYVGIDPNEWLREDNIKKFSDLIQEKKALFFNNSDFDISNLGKKFDIIFSHSILSHCADWQLDQFLINSKKVLSKDGKILSSFRLAEGNSFGSEGSFNKKDSNDIEWQYPGVSWFTEETIIKKAELYGFKSKIIPEYTEFYTMRRPNEFHDWVLFSLK